MDINKITNPQITKQQIQESHTPSEQSLDTKQSFSKTNVWKTGFFVLLGLVLVGSILSYYLLTQSAITEVTPAPQDQETETIDTTITEENKTEKLLVVNANSSIIDKRGPYFTFQLKYPSKYFVTSDNMITSYDSQGGMAPPRLIFTKSNQPLGEKNYWDIWTNSEDCILVWSTSGWNSIEDWDFGNPPEIISKEKITVLSSYQADKRVVKYSDKQLNNLEVFVQLPENVSYFFQTCNMNSEKDLEVILDNFRIRAFDIED